MHYNKNYDVVRFLIHELKSLVNSLEGEDFYGCIPELFKNHSIAQIYEQYINDRINHILKIDDKTLGSKQTPFYLISFKLESYYGYFTLFHEINDDFWRRVREYLDSGSNSLKIKVPLYFDETIKKSDGGVR